MPRVETARRKFVVQLVKPSHYDDDGYVIQWLRAFIPSNSLACVLSLVEDVKARRELGDDVDVVIDAYDECHTVVPVRKIIERIARADGGGIVLLVGVQSNQFPRATDLARELRAAGVMVAIGGFHVSGCVAMLPELPGEIRAVRDMGVSIFAGEAEGRIGDVLRHALEGRLQETYDFLNDMPSLGGAVTPALTYDIAKRYMLYTAFDAGRGCPFECSFCTIINVQGRKSRFRSADDVERIVRGYWAQGVRRFFITDDNFARNKNWEALLDRLIALRAEGLEFKFVIQVDTICHKIEGFVEKAARAGCNKVFIGLENINPDNLAAANKKQNRIADYRKMLLAWRSVGVLTYAGYILGFPADTPESIERDIRLIQRELPVDILEFMVLTPLPGSQDHKDLLEQGVWMDPDMNKYDLEHVTTRHEERMSPEELQAAYDRAWHQYYTPEHIETLVRRGEALGSGARRVATMIGQFYGSYCIEHVHPLQSGLIRRKVRRLRRSTFPLENPLVFYPRYLWEVIAKSWKTYAFWRRLDKLRERVKTDPDRKRYTDVALSLEAADEERLEMLQPVAGRGRREQAANEPLATRSSS